MSNYVKLGVIGFLAIGLSACFEEKVPEPTAENCAAGAYEKNLAELSKDSNRSEFKEACASKNAAQKMTEWKFEKSPKGKY
ncbi:entry exclusion lipoprotein TrbK [Pseudomonas putida S610]|uniref:entry exclusion lipoprotein TrbK n=1 Tax=Pseudomonas putida group TaxID=136845 RepID=UPI0003C629B5|nr:entry exclusion lipoprotein TrbK [Pseudomonas putida]EST17756.1 entry exclusion lipoprotein TrbK [Pseudomonas putida S610]